MKIAIAALAALVIATPALAGGGSFGDSHFGRERASYGGSPSFGGGSRNESMHGPRQGSGQCNRCEAVEVQTGRVETKNSWSWGAELGFNGPVPQPKVRWDSPNYITTKTFGLRTPARGMDADGGGCACNRGGRGPGDR